MRVMTRRTASDKDHSHKRRLRDRLWLRVTSGVVAVLLVVVGWSVGHALTVSGGGSVSERLAEWARDHYLGPVVTFGEWLTYSPPKKGGQPSISLTAPGSPFVNPREAGQKQAISYGPPPTLKTFASRALPGEGVWRVLATAHGDPAIYGTYLRASSVYSSYVVGVASMNQNLLRFELRPGVEDPGPGNWKASPGIAPGTRTGLEATFNGGFKIATAGGGFYLNGLTRGTLTNGAASLVYYRDGHLAIGVWGRSLHLTPDVVGVRQNLKPIVENGKVPASVSQNILTQWGATLGGGYYVWRSGIGITASGRIVFAYGPALNVQELAAVLQRAGVVTGIQLDINPDWMSFEYYRRGNHPRDPTPVNLLPNQIQPPDRYYSLSSRDFTAVYAQP
jgi:Phosphodiester glycosidase